MTITKEITKLEQSNVKLTLTVGKDDIHGEYDKMLSEYTKNIQIPGFRKGKVPREVLIRKFGDALKDEALGRLVEKSVKETFDDESFPREDRPLPYSSPELQDEQNLTLDLDKDFQFAVVYDVLPKVAVGKSEGFEIIVPDVCITDEDIGRELETVRERNAIVLDKDESEAAAKDDVITVNYCELDNDGNVKENTERQDYVFTVGSGQTYYKFDDEVTGMKKNESKEIEKTYPEDFEYSELAGKTVKLRITVTAIKLKKLPDLDDDLAQDVDEKFKTLHDLKHSIRDRLSAALDQRLRSIKSDKLLEMLIENTPVIIPESMIRLELDSRWRNLARRFNTDAQGLYKMMTDAGQNSQGFLDEWRPDATKAIHARLIVETMIEDLKIEASDEDADKEIDDIISRTPGSSEQIREYYRNGQMKDYMKEEIKERKLFDILFEKNTVKAGEKTNYIDLMANNG